MNAYEALARWYDRFTTDVPYVALAEYYAGLLGIDSGTALDLCCGTGTLTLLLAQRGFEMIGVDASSEMLAEAAIRDRGFSGTPPLYLCQRAEELDLYGTVSGAVCCLDGLNYLSPTGLAQALYRVGLFLEPGGVFAFDIQSPQALREKDGGVFVDETPDALCLWRGEFDEDTNALWYGVDLFWQEGSVWHRAQEEHVEYAHSHETLARLLTSAGFHAVEQRRDGPIGDEGRLYYRAVKEKNG